MNLSCGVFRMTVRFFVQAGSVGRKCLTFCCDKLVVLIKLFALPNNAGSLSMYLFSTFFFNLGKFPIVSVLPSAFLTLGNLNRYAAFRTGQSLLVALFHDFDFGIFFCRYDFFVYVFTSHKSCTTFFPVKWAMLGRFLRIRPLVSL